jgi:hypothetical protein
MLCGSYKRTASAHKETRRIRIRMRMRVRRREEGERSRWGATQAPHVMQLTIHQQPSIGTQQREEFVTCLDAAVLGGRNSALGVRLQRRWHVDSEYRPTVLETAVGKRECEIERERRE